MDSILTTRHFITVMKYMIGVGNTGNILFGTIWCVYFIFRLNILRNKVYYLKKQTDERCLDELRNTKVDYVKSTLIAAISGFEALWSLSLIGITAFEQIRNPRKSCSTGYFTEYSYTYPLYRGILLLIYSSIIVSISLIHILTSYLSHAYSEKRITNIMRRERVMFAWLFIQLVCVWCSIFYWPLFVLTLPIMAVIALIGHLCLYWKYGRELYSVIRRRERDALFEDVHSHRKLSEMLKSYKFGSIIYATAIIFALGPLTFYYVESIVKAVILDDCFTQKYINIRISATLTPMEGKKIELAKQFFVTLFFMLAIWFFLFIHVSILCKVMARMFKRRVAMSKPTKFSRSILYQPLIGNK